MFSFSRNQLRSTHVDIVNSWRKEKSYEITHVFILWFRCNFPLRCAAA